MRVEFLDGPKIDLILKLIQASLSPVGYEKVRDAMKTNHFLGELLNSRPILNQFSYKYHSFNYVSNYSFCLFGKPSTSDPWGWSYYGHHLCVNVFVWGGQMVISPVFIGAEPNVSSHQISSNNSSLTKVNGKESVYSKQKPN